MWNGSLWSGVYRVQSDWGPAILFVDTERGGELHVVGRSCEAPPPGQTVRIRQPEHVVLPDNLTGGIMGMYLRGCAAAAT